MAIFHDVKKVYIEREFYFPYNTFVCYICEQGFFFFREYIEMELKIIFITFAGFFKCQK